MQGDAIGFKIRLHDRQQGAGFVLTQGQRGRVGQGRVFAAHGPVAGRDPGPGLAALGLQLLGGIAGRPGNQAIGCIGGHQALR